MSLPCRSHVMQIWKTSPHVIPNNQVVEGLVLGQEFVVRSNRGHPQPRSDSCAIRKSTMFKENLAKKSNYLLQRNSNLIAQILANSNIWEPEF